MDSYVQLPHAWTTVDNIDEANRTYCREVLVRINITPVTYRGILDQFTRFLKDVRDSRELTQMVNDYVRHLDSSLVLLEQAGCIRKFQQEEDDEREEA
jgi:predicted component of type VI protein secretion system